ncbi:MAG: hypothetical protein LBD55_08265 [Treponema sp.]|jgi:hypothetical protein|nr:hypothetical protein [Treponema sp.]
MFNFRTFVGVLAVMFCSAGCGGGSGGALDWVLPSTGTYQINAYINEYSLNECSIIRQNDTVRPYFIHSVADDPDIQGLIVFLQDPLGTVAGKKTWYTVKKGDGAGFIEAADPPPAVEPEITPELPAASEPEITPEPPVAPESEITPEPPLAVEPEKAPELPVTVEPEITPEPPLAVESEVIPEPPLAVEPEKAPELPLASEPEPIAESLVVSESPVYHEPAVPADDYSEIPGLEIKRNVIENWSEYRMIPVDRLDRECPSFKLTETLEIGQYLMVFQVLGETDMLYQIERPIYFLGNAELTFDDIQRYLPGFAANTYFIAPGINILLEAQVVADKRLDAYIVWYNGRKSIGEGRVADGANRLVWKAPEQTGFYTIKAVVFPFRPGQNTGINGMVKELSLAVSSKGRNTGFFSKKADRFMYWYQFQSNLLDSKVPGDERRSLLPKDYQKPQWLTYNRMYGLAVGTADRYLLPDTSFTFGQGEQGSGQLVFQLIPVSEGTLFSAVFKTFDNTHLSPSDPLTMTLSLSKTGIMLTLTFKDIFYEESLSLETLDKQDIIMPCITFSLNRSQIAARVSLEETGMETKEIAVGLTDFLTGEGTFQLGETGAAPEVVAIFDELGVVFTKTPLLPKTKS